MSTRFAVFKHPLGPGRTELDLAERASIVSVKVQGTEYVVLYTYGQIEPAPRKERRTFVVLATGEDCGIDPTGLRWIDTVEVNETGIPLFFHVAELVPYEVRPGVSPPRPR